MSPVAIEGSTITRGSSSGTHSRRSSRLIQRDGSARGQWQSDRPPFVDALTPSVTRRFNVQSCEEYSTPRWAGIVETGESVRAIELSSGDEMDATIRRDGEERSVELPVGTRPQ